MTTHAIIYEKLRNDNVCVLYYIKKAKNNNASALRFMKEGKKQKCFDIAVLIKKT